MHWAEYGTSDSEADLLSEFYHQCKLAGLCIRMEVFVPSTLHRSKRLRADCAIYRHGRIFALIEGKTPGAKIGGNTRQKHAYNTVLRDYGIKTYWLNGMDQIEPLVRKLVRECP